MGDDVSGLEAANEIIRKIVKNIKDSRQQLFLVIENLRKDYETKILELNEIKEVLANTIKEVDHLEISDKKIRQLLIGVSKQFDEGYEERIRETYEKAMQIRVQLGLGKEKEKSLRKKRDDLERKLKEGLKNIEATEIMAQQVNVAMKYLEKDLADVMDQGKDFTPDVGQGLDILKAQEAERARIGREIHDGPAQHMANVLMMVDFCKIVIDKDMEAGLKELESLKSNVKVALKEVRRILFDLKPIALEELGLNQAVEELIENIIVDTQLQVVKNLKEIKEEIEPMVQIAIYRIIQEIFHNIRKHSKATKVSIQLDSGTDTLVLIVADNGVGFDVEKTLYQVNAGRQSYGLVGIQERVRQLGGSVNIKSESNKGTMYYIKFPIK
ncbi:MAG: histidine kinase [Cellulosilyticaceae bacterium]